MPSTPALAAQYAASSGFATTGPVTELMLTMRP